MTYFISLNQDISLHSNTYEKIQANANQIWKYERYYLVMEYDQRPVLVPPFIIINHVLCFMRYLCRCLRNCRGREDKNGQDGSSSDRTSKNLIVKGGEGMALSISICQNRSIRIVCSFTNSPGCLAV